MYIFVKEEDLILHSVNYYNKIRKDFKLYTKSTQTKLTTEIMDKTIAEYFGCIYKNGIKKISGSKVRYFTVTKRESGKATKYFINSLIGTSSRRKRETARRIANMTLILL